MKFQYLGIILDRSPSYSLPLFYHQATTFSNSVLPIGQDILRDCSRILVLVYSFGRVWDLNAMFDLCYTCVNLCPHLSVELLSQFRQQSPNMFMQRLSRICTYQIMLIIHRFKKKHTSHHKNSEAQVE